MFNVEKPNLDDMPSLSDLRRFTLLAVAGAIIIVVTVVMPAERGVDPTGAGHMLGLTQMGEIKQELKHEAESDQEHHQNNQSYNVLDNIFGFFITPAVAQEAWRETITFTLEPGEHTETKLVMNEGDQAQYVWTAAGGRINFDLHAHGGGQSKTYEKGRGAAEGEGSIVAPFKGEHGWFWRNRDKSAITITLKINGDYLEMIRSE